MNRFGSAKTFHKRGTKVSNKYLLGANCIADTVLKLILYEDARAKALTFQTLTTWYGVRKMHRVFVKCVETRMTGDESVYSRETEPIGGVSGEREILRNPLM